MSGHENFAPSPPDLQILVRREPSKLSFEVRSECLGLQNQPLGSLSLEGNPQALVQEELGRSVANLSDLAEEGEEGQENAREQLADLAVNLFQKLPQKLRELLWSQQGEIETMQILSDEPYIPWELLKLQGEGGEEGPFLCEVFAVTRWLREFRQTVFTFPLQRFAFVLSPDDLPSAQAERDDLSALFGKERVTEIEPSLTRVKHALKFGFYDGWHFIGHGSARTQDPDRMGFELAEQVRLTPANLVSAKANLNRLQPLIFLNGCDTGRGGFSLTGLGGWTQKSLEAGAGAFIGTLWPVRDKKARAFAHTFYQHFLDGEPIGQAVQQARLKVRARFPGDPAWLAYTVYAHPSAICSSACVSVGRRALQLPPLPDAPAPATPEGRSTSEETFEVLPLAARLRPQGNTRIPQQVPRGYRFLGQLDGLPTTHFFRERDGHVAVALPNANNQGKLRLFDKYAITNQQFCRFLNDLIQQDLAHVERRSDRVSQFCVDAWGHPLAFDAYDRWQGGRERHPAPRPSAPWGMTCQENSWKPLAGSNLLPATLVTWWGVRLYGLWVHSEPIHYEGDEAPFLPDISQWQEAALWDPWAGRFRRFPWGDEWRREWVNYAGYWAGEEILETGLRERTDGLGSGVLPLPVASLDKGQSPLGCIQMIGNVWEWCADSAPSSEVARLVVGGACNSPREHCDPRSSRTWRREQASDFLGFRCCFANKV